MLLKIIFKANRNKNRFIRLALHLKNWASYVDFHELKKFKSQNLDQFLIFGPEFLQRIPIFI